jgi:hypothetical protein
VTQFVNRLGRGAMDEPVTICRVQPSDRKYRHAASCVGTGCTRRQVAGSCQLLGQSPRTRR